MSAHFNQNIHYLIMTCTYHKTKRQNSPYLQVRAGIIAIGYLEGNKLYITMYTKAFKMHDRKCCIGCEKLKVYEKVGDRLKEYNGMSKMRKRYELKMSNAIRVSYEEIEEFAKKVGLLLL